MRKREPHGNPFEPDQTAPRANGRGLECLFGEPRSGAEIVREVTGGNARLQQRIREGARVRAAYEQLQVAIQCVQDGKDLVVLRLQQYCEALDIEIERFQPK